MNDDITIKISRIAIKTETFCTAWDGQLYCVDICEDSEERRAWLYNSRYGIKMLMWGESAEYNRDEFLDRVFSSLPDYIEYYQDDVYALENACEYNPNLEADERLVEIYDRTLKNCEFYENEQNYPALLNEIGCLRGIAYSIEQVAGRDCLDECIDYDAYHAMIERAEELKKSLDNTSKDEIR